MTQYKLTKNKETIDTTEIDGAAFAGSATKSIEAAFEYFAPEMPSEVFDKMELTEKDGWVAVVSGDIWTVETAR